MLDTLVQEHLAAHGHDPQRSLAALPAAGAMAQNLGSLADPDVQASLAQVGNGSVSDGRTAAYRPAAAGRYSVLRPHAQSGQNYVAATLGSESPPSGDRGTAGLTARPL
jgi:hypothetical protein